MFMLSQICVCIIMKVDLDVIMLILCVLLYVAIVK